MGRTKKEFSPEELATYKAVWDLTLSPKAFSSKTGISPHLTKRILASLGITVGTGKRGRPRKNSQQPSLQTSPSSANENHCKSENEPKSSSSSLTIENASKRQKKVKSPKISVDITTAEISKNVNDENNNSAAANTNAGTTALRNMKATISKTSTPPTAIAQPKKRGRPRKHAMSDNQNTNEQSSASGNAKVSQDKALGQSSLPSLPLSSCIPSANDLTAAMGAAAAFGNVKLDLANPPSVSASTSVSEDNETSEDE